MTSLVSQEKRLIDLVMAECERQCAEAERDANEKAVGLLRDARREGRERARTAVLRERNRARSRIDLARAELETQKRLHAQRRAKALIDKAWLLLNERLVELWRDSNERQRWIRRAARLARRLVTAKHWRVSHPVDWSAEDQTLFVETLGNALENPPVFHPDDSISAGLLVRSGGVVLDMTLHGMNADRTAVEARLLALIDEIEAGGANQAQDPDSLGEGEKHG